MNLGTKRKWGGWLKGIGAVVVFIGLVCVLVGINTKSGTGLAIGIINIMIGVAVAGFGVYLDD